MSKAIGNIYADNEVMLKECDPTMIQVAKKYELELLLGEIEKADNGYFTRLYVVTGNIGKWVSYLDVVKHQSGMANVKFNCTVEEVRYEH